MFQDLAVLVQQQSEMLDSIESNVETAGKYVRKGNEAVRRARVGRLASFGHSFLLRALTIPPTRPAAQGHDRVPEEDAQVLLLLYCARAPLASRRA